MEFFCLAWGVSLFSFLCVRVDITLEQAHFFFSPLFMYAACLSEADNRAGEGEVGGNQGLFWGQILQRCKNTLLAQHREILNLSAVIMHPSLSLCCTTD